MTTVINIRSGQRFDHLILRPSYYSNPFLIGANGGRDSVLALYDRYLTEHPEIVERAREELTGKTIGCVCKPYDCHGDVLVAHMERRTWR